VVLAALVEIPSAIFSVYLARSVNRRVIEAARLGRYRAPVLAEPRGQPAHRTVTDQRGGPAEKA
jgi:hypothetical protein